ncbi:MAG: hypothetical protein NDF54_01445 [archaeon GB-1867-035]|nr:hypothetical protein [Candidatus Culexmicrobium profundum]
MSIFQRLGRLDPRVFFTLLIFAVAIPIISPLGLPVPITQPVLDAYNYIENLPEGSVVLYSMSVAGGGWDDVGGGVIATMQHLFSRPVKIIIFSYFADSVPWVEYTLNNIDKHGKKYGEDYVWLGYLAGGEAMLAGLASSIRSITTTDAYGTPLDNLPMMKDIDNIHDIDLIVHAEISTIFEAYLRQFQAPYGKPIILICPSMMVTMYFPYYPNQAIGIIGGVRGSAEYELLIHRPGMASVSTDTLSTTHILIIVMIIMGNIGYYFERKIRRGE